MRVQRIAEELKKVIEAICGKRLPTPTASVS
jgi:hypothetical protein